MRLASFFVLLGACGSGDDAPDPAGDLGVLTFSMRDSDAPARGRVAAVGDVVEIGIEPIDPEQSLTTYWVWSADEAVVEVTEVQPLYVGVGYFCFECSPDIDPVGAFWVDLRAAGPGASTLFVARSETSEPLDEITLRVE